MNPLLYDYELAIQEYLLEPYPSIEARKERINRLIAMVNENEENLCKVIQADFQFRNPIETQLAELSMVRSTAKFYLSHLARWAAKRRVPTPSHLKPSKSYIQPQPKGIVGIMSPWNYPLSLALIPVITTFAAGNRVWLKPSERSARTSGYLSTLIQQYFNPAELRIITGGPDVAQHFAELPFHHLLFTGSTQTGQLVAKAAAENLTPVTLELGGKSPAIIDQSVNLKDACTRIIYGKLFNGGQTCIAPDYVLIPSQLFDEGIQALQNSFRKLFPNPEEITQAIDKVQLARWKHLLQDVLAKGGNILPLGPQEASEQDFFMPKLVTNLRQDMALMNEEIFGPILPVISYYNFQEAVEFINKRPNPLCLYYFGQSKTNVEYLQKNTKSGGMTLNDTLLHYSSHYLPFGGVGASGMGTYHGQFGFDTFSHLKPVLEMRSFLGIKSLGGTKMAHPPYGKKIKKLLKIL